MSERDELARLIHAVPDAGDGVEVHTDQLRADAVLRAGYRKVSDREVLRGWLVAEFYSVAESTQEQRRGTFVFGDVDKFAEAAVHAIERWNG